MKHLLPRVYWQFDHRRYFVCSVFVYTDCNKRDRLLALLLGLRYRQVVTLKRTYITVTMFWVVSIVGGPTYFRNNLISLWWVIIAILLCLVTSIFCYSKIVFTLRHRQIQGQPSQTSALNIARYRKTVSSTLWVQLTLVVCYLPFGIV